MYSEKINGGSDSKFEVRIDSDVSDTELLKLQWSLKKLNSKKIQCNLVDAMITLQAAVIK